MEALDQLETQVLTPDDVELAGTLLRVGDLVAIPTETVYGLGANGLAADGTHLCGKRTSFRQSINFTCM